ncbi:MAG: SRPBCC family protein [Xanthobacteraceae bacterium]
MAKAYYSTVFAQSADDVWNTIRDFNNYPIWVDGAGESRIEDGKSGDAVGAVRDVLYRGKRIRQRLVALSDPERAQVYEFCGAAPMPVQHYRATLRITPVVDGGRGFVEWWATFDCAPERHDEWTVFFRDAFAGWLASLRRYLEGRNGSSVGPVGIEAAGIPAHTE